MTACPIYSALSTQLSCMTSVRAEAHGRRLPLLIRQRLVDVPAEHLKLRSSALHTSAHVLQAHTLHIQILWLTTRPHQHIPHQVTQSIESIPNRPCIGTAHGNIEAYLRRRFCYSAQACR